MSIAFENHKPAECLLLLDGLFHASCDRDTVHEQAKQLARENPDSVIDAYTHAGTMRLRNPPNPTTDTQH